MPADVAEDMRGDAAARRNLSGNNLFENLGDPIKKLLIAVEKEGKDVDDKTMELLTHVTVKQLAKIWEMLGQGEDPETILAWLKRRARKNRGGQDDWKEERKKMIKTGAERDPIAFFKELEAANAEKMKEFEEQQEEREQLRKAKAKEREKQRAEQQKAAEEARKAVEDEGGWWKVTDYVPEKDKNAVADAFEKFATDGTDFDNAEKDQDGEWWKRDPFRRDWERNKGKGKKWTPVLEGGKERATDEELAVREEFYKGNDWWKADKYKRDWETNKDTDWWKEEPYIKDWQQNKHDGLRWRAADEESGLEGEANQFPATAEEQKRREDWYKANGPRGVVKAWNAATEGDKEKCSVPEKEAREEFYRNGDWWKNDDAANDFWKNGLDADALQSAKAPTDTDWWKQEPFREDYWKNGPEGKKWNALTEAAGVDGEGDKKPAPEMEKKRREEWYKDNWWKKPEHKEDWKKNGKNGKAWKAPTEADAKAGGGKKPVGPTEQGKREEWYKHGDEEWWKKPEYVEDYFQKGPEGRHWPAKTEDDAKGGRGQEAEAKAKPDEQKKREEWYRANWWKQPKYIDDFHKNGTLGDAWQSKQDDPNLDKEWWKQAPFIENWQKSMKGKSQPEGQEWWKQPQYLEDFNVNGAKGKKWTADRETNGMEGKGDESPASGAEQAEREKWYKDNWWKAPRFAMDWAKKGPTGNEWKAKSRDAAEDPKRGARKEPCSPEEMFEREAWYRPVGDMWRAVAEGPGFEKRASELPCTKADALKRDEWYRTNWWKAPEYLEDWKKNGTKGKKWTAGNEPAGRDGKGDQDPCSQEEAEKRDNWYRNAGDNEWWKEPQYCEDWANQGPDGLRWTANNRPNANKNGGKENPCTPAEQAERDQWYKDNWWKTPAAFDDWKKNGKDGVLCGRDKPIELDRTDPETLGDNWWKKPEHIEDWLKNGDEGRGWTAEDPTAAAAQQGHKKPAPGPEQEARAKWYKDNWWKAPSCADDWAKKGPEGDRWQAKTPEATKAGAGKDDPADEAEKEKRADWYRKHGDGDDWWKKPQFVEDWAKHGPEGQKWTAGNPTAGALGLAKDCPASGPEKDKRDKWYKDNWWKAPEHIADWAKGPAGTGSWKRDATPEEEKERDAWYKKNKGEPASDPEKAKRDAWYRKHGKEPSGPQLGKREDWYKKQLPDDEKAKRMEWLRDREGKEKRILEDELPEALKAANQGQMPTEKQVKAVMDKIEWNRKAKKDDFDDDAWKKKNEDGGAGDDDEEEGPTIGKREFVQAILDAGMYVAPDEELQEMAEEDEKAKQEMDNMARQEEEAAFLAMDKKEQLADEPENWQLNHKDPEQDEWWKKPKYIDQYQKDPEDEDAMWRKEVEKGKAPATPAEQAAREQWMKDNWWKAPKYSQDWRQNNGDSWKKQGRPEEDEDGMVRDDDETPEATPEEVAARDEWYRNAKNPERQKVDDDAADGEDWKRPAMVENYQEGGDDWKRGAKDDDEVAKREDWLKDNWWKAPKHADNWKREQRGEEPEDDVWKRQMRDPEQAGDDGEDDDGMGRNDKEITPEEKQRRDEWYRKAIAPEEAKPKEDTWESARKPEPEPEEPVPETWKSREPPPPPPPAKQGWVSQPKKVDEEAKPDVWVSKRPPPPPVVVKEDTWVSKPKEEVRAPPPPPPVEMPPPPPPEEPFFGEKLREEDFEFFGEKLREDDFEVFNEEEAEFFGEKLREEDFGGEKFVEEVAEFFGEKLREEDFDGEKFNEEEAEFFGEKLREEDFMERYDEEVAEFFGEKLREEDFVKEEAVTWEKKYVNEDDKEEEEYEDPASEPEAEMEVEEPREEDSEEMEPEEEPEDDPWDAEEDEEAEEAEESEEDGESNEHMEDTDIEDEVEAGLESDEGSWDEDDEDDEDEAEKSNDDETGSMEDQEDKAPEPWMLPLPEVTNNIYLKSYFPVLKWHAGKQPTAADRRVWVVDHFAKSFYCLDPKGQMKKQHDANKLLQLERNIMDPRRARLMFFDAPKSYEVIFQSNEDRERFYETGSSIRPAIRVYAPSLTKPDTAHDGGSTTTTIDGVKENAVTQKVPNPFKKTGEMVDRELTGRCKINSSKVQDEPVSVWCGTFNMCGAPPPRDSSTLEDWMPRGKYDLYAVGCQEMSYQKDEGEWFEYVQNYLGKEYLVLASMQMWDITIIVLCRKKCLLKITNVEGSTKATLHKEKCGMKGAAGISLKYHNTSMAFVSCHLAARLERTKMRRINIEEIVNKIQLANKDTDMATQFHHVFLMGDLNYRVEMENAEADDLLKEKKYLDLLEQDQLLTEMRETGILHGFQEAPITFPPTYRYKVGSNDYMRDRGRAPSYTDRILYKSFGNTDLKCTSYRAAENVRTSEHMPVCATYTVRCLRPHASCFHRDQEPRPQFNFEEIVFTEQTHLMFRKPMVMMYTPFSEHAHRGKPMKTSTMLPEFRGESLPQPIQCCVQMTEYLERNAILIIFRDTAEAREDKMFRGCAVMELKDCVEPYDEERTATLDVLCLSRKVGTVSVKYKVTNYGYTPPPGGAPGRVPKETLMDPE